MKVLRILGVSSLVACVALFVCAVVVDAGAYESASRYTPDEAVATPVAVTHLDESVLAEHQMIARRLGQAGGIAGLTGILFGGVVWFRERKYRRRSKSRRTYIRPRSRVHS